MNKLACHIDGAQKPTDERDNLKSLPGPDARKCVDQMVEHDDGDDFERGGVKGEG